MFYSPSHSSNCGHDASARAAAGNLAPSYQPGGAVALVAPMCVNTANSGDPTADSMVWWFAGGPLDSSHDRASSDAPGAPPRAEPGVVTLSG